MSDKWVIESFTHMPGYFLRADNRWGPLSQARVYGLEPVIDRDDPAMDGAIARRLPTELTDRIAELEEELAEVTKQRNHQNQDSTPEEDPLFGGFFKKLKDEGWEELK